VTISQLPPSSSCQEGQPYSLSEDKLAFHFTEKIGCKSNDPIFPSLALQLAPLFSAFPPALVLSTFLTHTHYIILSFLFPKQQIHVFLLDHFYLHAKYSDFFCLFKILKIKFVEFPSTHFKLLFTIKLLKYLKYLITLTLLSFP
jgi:hypothetical protein